MQSEIKLKNIYLDFPIYDSESMSLRNKIKTIGNNVLKDKKKVKFNRQYVEQSTRAKCDPKFIDCYYKVKVIDHDKNYQWVIAEKLDFSEDGKSFLEKNQTTSNLDYELRFNYSLMLNEENCVVYEKVILSNFSIIPKSAGYNYGTDSSLETRYEASVKNNLDQFVSFLSSVDINNC